MEGDTLAVRLDAPLTGLPPLPARQRAALLAVAGAPILLYLLAAPYGGLIGLPTVLLLKDRLHLSASGAAVFGLLVATPLFLGPVFGFIRDRWSPWGAGDRGHLIVFGGLAGALYAGMALAPTSYGELLLGVIAVTACAQFVTSAAQGLATEIGRRHRITGQASTMVNIVTNVAVVISVLLGGRLALGVNGDGGARYLFFVGAALFFAIGLFGLVGPPSLFSEADRPAPGAPLAEFRRLVSTPVIYAPLLIQLLWNFMPGFGVALQYHLINDLHARADQVGLFYAVCYGSIVPAIALYGWLARRYSLHLLLWIGALLAVPQMMTLFFVHTPVQAIWASGLLGAMGGIATTAYWDLCMRAAPKGLESTMMMLLLTMYWVAVRGGDVWGAYLFDHHGGFNTTLWASTAVYALILPALLLIPKRIVAAHDA